MINMSEMGTKQAQQSFTDNTNRQMTVGKIDCTVYPEKTFDVHLREQVKYVLHENDINQEIR